MTSQGSEDRQILASDEFYTKAHDYLQFILGEVDTRTGAYRVQIAFPSGEGNQLRGPNFSFRLAHDPLDTTDYGFGKGWKLGLSEFDRNTSILSLNAGDVQRAEGLAIGHPAILPDIKGTPFRLIPLSEYDSVVEYATGVTEYLRSDISNTYLQKTQHIINPSGDGIHLRWGDRQGRRVLLSVVDDSEMELMSLDYSDFRRVVLTIHTGLAQPLQVYFDRDANALLGVTIPSIRQLNILRSGLAEDDARWEFQYQNVGAAQDTYLVSITSPEGIRESVSYIPNGLQLPNGAPRGYEYMPIVGARNRFSIHQNKLLDATRYRFDINVFNYFGNRFVTNWQSRNDQLLHSASAGTYKYQSQEIQLDPRDTSKELCTINYLYNNFHLLEKQVTKRGTVVQETITDYNILVNRNFNDQKTSFQLPKLVTTTLYDEKNPNVKQVTKISSTYDDDIPGYKDPVGALISQHDDSTGVTERKTYYPIEGVPGRCPKDPLGMVRRLESTTVEPGTSGAPIVTTEHRYREIKVRSDLVYPGPKAATYVQSSDEIVSADGKALIHSSQTFYEENGEQHGAIQSEIRTQDGLTERREFIYERRDGNVVTITRLTSNDGIVSHTQEAKRLVSGLTMWSVDALENITTYDYDILGRITRETYSPDVADYETVSTQHYQLTLNERWALRIGITGLPHRVWTDERGAVIRRDEPLQPGDQSPSFVDAMEKARGGSDTEHDEALIRLMDESMMTVTDVTYDHFGQVQTETIYDTLHTLTTSYTYDDYGQASDVVAPDKTRSRSERELVRADDGKVMLRTRQWQESADGAMRSGWVSTDVDAAGLKRRVEVGSWDGLKPHVEAAGEWHYDGLGRCIRELDAMKQETRRSWDAFSRPSSIVLPNGDTVAWSYAPGQAGELLAAIDITPAGGSSWRVGTRVYDGLWRIQNETAGNLSYAFEYKAKQLSPSVHILPSGTRITNTYDSRLGEVLNEQRVEGTSEPIKSAIYNKKLGLPSSVSSEMGAMLIETDFLGRMNKQTIVYPGAQSREAMSVLTRGGLERSVHGVDGSERTYQYDDAGRLINIIDALPVEGAPAQEISTSFEYDGLSRVIVRKTEDAAQRRYTEERTSFDGLGRPERTWWISTDETVSTSRNLTLTFRADDKVESKTWREGSSDEPVRTESFIYDSRGRLITHTIQAKDLDYYPRDEGDEAYKGAGPGNPYDRQTFTYDEIDNLLTVTTRIIGTGQENVTRYDYDTVDRDRLIYVTNTMKGYPGEGGRITLTYDASGNMTSDGIGNTLTWDDLGRPSSVTTVSGVTVKYEYGPDGRVAKVTRDQQPAAFRYYSDGQLHLEAGEDERRFIRSGRYVIAESLISKAIRDSRRTVLLEFDGQGSVSSSIG